MGEELSRRVLLAGVVGLAVVGCDTVPVVPAQHQSGVNPNASTHWAGTSPRRCSSRTNWPSPSSWSECSESNWVRWPFPKGPDWIDPSTGALYDTIGFEASFFDSEWQLGRLQNSIMKHLKKAHFVPIDVSDLRPDQLAKVRAFIEPYAPKVFLVGVK